MTEDRHYITVLDSQFGELTLIATDKGLRAVRWPTEMANRAPLPDEITGQPDHPMLRATRDQLLEYLGGERKSFDLPFDLRGTVFQEKAWLALASIPYGATTTYSEQAARLGRPKAARAVGAANGRNPISIILPCHRVVGASGHLTGFAGGLDTKKQILEFEKENAVPG
jgi:methylated-DNA-[protein]-cysteine S-methyltransferase